MEEIKIRDDFIKLGQALKLGRTCEGKRPRGDPERKKAC